MNLFSFLLVIVSLSCGSFPPLAEPDPVRAVVATCGMVLAWILLAHVSARTIARSVVNEQLDPLGGARWLELQLEAFRWLGLAVAVLCLVGFGVAPLLNNTIGFSDSMFLQACVLLLPGVVMTVGTWTAEHRYGVLLGYTSGGFSGYWHSTVASLRGGVGMLCIPLLVLLVLADGISRLPASGTVLSGLTLGVVLLGVPFGLPLLVRYLVSTEPIDEPTKRWVDSLMVSAGVGRPLAVRWKTGGSTFNAMVAGFMPHFRALLVSDRLLDQLPREQVAMVILHEAAHLRRRHVLLRILAVLPAWLIGSAASQFVGEGSWSVAIGSAIGILATLAILRIVAYRTEFDADVTACRLATEASTTIEGVPSTFESAAASLATALMRVTEDNPAARRATWLHPGVEARVAWMLRHREAPTNSSTSAGTAAKPA